jgi:hypothetical protein
VISGYSVACAALLVTGARLGDDLGHRSSHRAPSAGRTSKAVPATWRDSCGGSVHFIATSEPVRRDHQGQRQQCDREHPRDQPIEVVAVARRPVRARRRHEKHVNKFT